MNTATQTPPPKSYTKDTLVLAVLAGNTTIGVVTTWPRIRLLASSFKEDKEHVGEERIKGRWMIQELASPEDAPGMLATMTQVAKSTGAEIFDTEIVKRTRLEILDRELNSRR